MNGLQYLLTSDAVNFTAAGAMMTISAPADAAVIIDRIEVTQESVTSSEANAIQVNRASDTGTGGGARTPAPAQVGFPAAGTSAKDGSTVWSVQPTLTTLIMRKAFNLLTGFLWHPTPNEHIVLSPSGILCIRLENAPAGSTAFSIDVQFREIGG
ncbi:MAG: hypothetical protein OEW52_00155 [Thermoleophilia bacterium]|nr:hypothetical protein [Thermoleophilia bacterium]